MASSLAEALGVATLSESLSQGAARRRRGLSLERLHRDDRQGAAPQTAPTDKPAFGSARCPPNTDKGRKLGSAARQNDALLDARIGTCTKFVLNDCTNPKKLGNMSSTASEERCSDELSLRFLSLPALSPKGCASTSDAFRGAALKISLLRRVRSSGVLKPNSQCKHAASECCF